MEELQQRNDEQAELWNGPAARAWVESQDVLDRLFKPLEELLVAAVAAKPRAEVLDVGCGTGGTTLAIARRLGAEARCTGIDISAPMIDAARIRTEREKTPAAFLCADVQSHTLETASFDAIVSRFGIMFFADPVQAFSNLRHAAREKGDLHVIAWRSPEENPFMTTAERVAAPLLPELPARNTDGPGQFAFADKSKVHAILDQSGWENIAIQPIDVVCTMSEKNIDGYMMRFGPVGRFLQEADESTRTQVAKVMRTAFEPYVHGEEVRFTAACWMISAQAQ